MKYFLLASICLFVICGAFYGGIYTEKKHEKSVQAITLNAKVAKANEAAQTIVKEKSIADHSQKVIVIDPGHSSIVNLETELEAPGSKIMKIKEPGGGHGLFTKIPEYVVNMAVAVKLRSLLEEKGYTVIMTKTQSKQVLGSIARAEIGNKFNADLVVRIHADSNNDTSAKGATMLVPGDTKCTDPIYKTSKGYGQIVFNYLIKEVGMNSRGIVESNNMTGFNWSKVPVMLIEMGFQSNAIEDKLLITDSYQAKIAKGLADGIDQALK